MASAIILHISISTYNRHQLQQKVLPFIIKVKCSYEKFSVFPLTKILNAKQLQNKLYWWNVDQWMHGFHSNSSSFFHSSPKIEEKILKRENFTKLPSIFYFFQKTS